MEVRFTRAIAQAAERGWRSFYPERERMYRKRRFPNVTSVVLPKVLPNKYLLGPSVIGLLTISLFLTASPPPVPVVRTEDAHRQEQRYLEDLKFLAAPDMEGRGAGTAGLERAAQYIEEQFKRLALQPTGPKSYEQDFRVGTGSKLGSRNRFSAGEKALVFDHDFRPFSFSENGHASGDLVFAGFGITAREHGYDDYANVDVKGKVVVVLRYEPKRFTKSEPGKQPVQSFHAHMINKAINARNHGAAAMLLVNADSGKDELIGFGKIAGPDNAHVPVAQVKRAVVNEWLKTSNTSLGDLESRINSENKPVSFAVPINVALDVDVTRQESTVHNIVGYLPGKSKEYIVVGAHYDHIGYGYQSSLAPEKAGKIHPGADDNASGTAGLLELARIFSQRRTELDRGILFIAFAGEELGLLGSERWLNNPTLPLENAVAMINLDMIGRVQGGKLFVGGVRSGSTFEAIVKEALAPYDFKPEYSFKDSSSSDHASFLSKDIPALFFFSGIHGDYHRPTDTWDKIDVVESAKVVDAVAEVVAGLMKKDARPEFVRNKERSERARRGRGAYLGVTPDFRPGDKGLRISDVVKDSPADAGGLEEGDMLVALGTAPIFDSYDLTYALLEAEVGQTVQMKVLRQGKPLTREVTLSGRSN